MFASRALAAAAVLILFCVRQAVADDWKDGRASFYGLDRWSIHKGSCGFGYQWPDIYPGFDVAAIADSSPEFSGSCGRCYEVKCRPGEFTDGYGEKISRMDACKDTSQSVVVRTVDNCPCSYSGNYYSNKRWCCGDSGSGSAHMDLSVWAFEKLAKTNHIGVMPISFRRVPCDTRPANPAPPVANPSPPEKPWSGAKRPDDQVYVKRFDSVGGPQDAVAAVDTSQVFGRPLVPVNQLFQGGSLQEAKDMGGGGGTPSSPSPSPSAATADAASSANGCTDAAPKDGKGCQQHKDWGNCNQNWLISANLCRATCGRCTLSSPAAASSQSGSSPSPSPPQSGGSPSPSPAPSPPQSQSGCADKQPTDGTTCAKHKEWNHCEQDWLKSGGFCQATCSRCGSGDSGKVASFEGPSSSASASASSSSSSSSGDSGCTEKPVPSTISWGDCSKQKEWHQCDSEWLKHGDYCAKTCGRCGGSGR